MNTQTALKAHIQNLRKDSHIRLNYLLAEAELEVAKDAFDLFRAAADNDESPAVTAAPISGHTLDEIKAAAADYPELAAILANA